MTNERAFTGSLYAVLAKEVTTAAIEEILKDLLVLYLSIVAIVATFAGVWRAGLVRGLIASILLPPLFFVPGNSAERLRAWLRIDDPP